MIDWYKKVVFENYANFNGRARRSEYWYYTLVNAIIAIIAMVIDNVAGIALEGIGYGPVYGLYLLAVLLPGLAVAVRRLHDVGKSGWFLLIALIPVIGFFWLLFLLIKEGDKGTNAYGPDPKNTIESIEEIGQAQE